MAGLQRAFAPDGIDGVNLGRPLIGDSISQFPMRRDKRGLRIVCHSLWFPSLVMEENPQKIRAHEYVAKIPCVILSALRYLNGQIANT
jgi:hypothetical protein